MGTNVPKPNRNSEAAAEQKLIDGLNKHAQAIQSIMIAGVSMTTKDVIAHLQARIDTADAVETARATWQNTVKTDKADRAKAKTFVSAVRQAILVAFAGSIDTLADFGLTPRKQVVRTPEQKSASAAKALATRAARHTLGKKQMTAVRTMVVAAVA